MPRKSTESGADQQPTITFQELVCDLCADPGGDSGGFHRAGLRIGPVTQ
jgi:hypothetical protein